MQKTKAKARVWSVLITLAVVVTTLFGSVPQTAFAAEPETDDWAAGITDEALVAEKKAVWMDSSKTVEERVQALLSCMTLEEKAAQLVQPEQGGTAGNTPASPEDVKNLGIGSVLSGGGSAPSTGNTAQDWKNRVNEYKAAALESRLGIPLIYGVDAVHGHNNVDNAVIFPHNVGLGAANDTEVTEKVGAAAAEEIRATGIQWTFAPTLGVVDNERWGRFYESYGENADRVAALGAAYVKGFQGTGEGLFADNKVAATAKHYIGEGQTTNGVNQGNVETDDFDALMQSKGLLTPYRAAIDAGARTVMVSYNSVNGVKCHTNKHLVTDILKGAPSDTNPLGLGFTGFVVSDYNGVDQLPDATFDAKVASSLDAGVDMFMEPYAWQNVISALVNGYKGGTITKERIDDAVSRILRVKFEMGLFEETVAGAAEQALLDKFGGEEHRAVAKEAAEKTLTLLKNDTVGETGKTALQLLEGANKITVAGYKANDVGAQCGGWTISWQGGLDANNGSGGNKVTEGTTIYEGFKEIAGEGKNVTYNARGKIAAGSEAAVVVVGEDPYAESNGDKKAEELTLTANDLNVIQTAIESKGNTPLILVLMTGRPVALADFIDGFDAVVEAWLPGTEGAAVASVMLDSAKDFTATTPVTWMWHPVDLGSKYTDPTKVLFPYNTGLKKDGTSIIEGGQTSIPGADSRPDAPAGDETEPVKKRDGGVDIDAYGGKLEAEYCNPTSGAFSSYNIDTGSEMDQDNKVGYVQWDQKDWGNAKWVAYIRQAGTYTVKARIKVTAAGNSDFKFGIGRAITGDGTTNMTIPSSVTDGYTEVTIGDVTLDGTGLYGIKIMDSSKMVKAKLDYLQFELKSASGDKDESQDEPQEDPKDETPAQSNGNIISQDAVNVWMTSTEKSQDMSWYKYPTKMANQMSEKDALDITSVDDSDYTAIYVDQNKKYQELLGMGTSLEEATINNLSQLTPEVQDEFLRKLVDPQQGGMTLFRITVGTSDFTAQKFYSYYDTRKLDKTNGIYNEKTKAYEPDWQNVTGKGFSIQKDVDYKIIDTVKKVIELAKEYGVEDEVKFFASSWTPPGWMKNETTASKSYKDNELLLKGGSLKDEAIDDLAMYYTRYLEEYAKQGIDIYAMTLQNEPMLEINYPSCAMTGEQEGKLAVAIKKAVAKSSVLNTEQKKCRLWAFDHNPGDAYSYVKKILSIEGANEALDGVAFHDYGGSLTNMQKVLDELLNQDGRNDQTVNLTERSVWGTTGANSIITYLRNSAISYNSWVTMLDSNVGVHQWVGTPDPTMFARAAGSDNDYWAMPEFYLTGQFSRFIRPGYVRVDSNLGSTASVTNVVFQNPETKELVAVVVNATDKKQNFKFVTDGTQFIGAIPAKNVATYVWKQPENIQTNTKDGFDAAKYAGASSGVTTENGAVSVSSEEDYIDYIISVKEAGDYYVTLEQQTADDNQKISIYQGDTSLKDVPAVKAEGKTKVRTMVNLAAGGVQQIRLKMTTGIKLYQVAVEKAESVHEIPGRIPADQFFGADQPVAVGEGHSVVTQNADTTITYKVNVPANDTYAVTPGAEAGASYTLTVDGTDATAAEGNQYTLTAGEHTIGIKLAQPGTLTGISIGSYLEVTAPVIKEGEENGKEIQVKIQEGTLAGTSDVTEGTERYEITGLPEGVEAAVETVNDTEMKITLSGNRTKDFDEDLTVAMKFMVKQTNGNVYPVTEKVIVTAVNDEENLIVPEQDLSVPAQIGDEKKITLKIEGGTFSRDGVSNIAAGGEAAKFYQIQSVEYKDTQTVEITLNYQKSFYREAALELTVLANAYDEGDKNLTVSVNMEPVDGFPEALELTAGQGITLTEDQAYANNGSLASNVVSGSYADYFLDVKKAGTYVVTYTINSLTSDGTGYSNAWDVNRGVPGSLGTNSYKQVSVPGLWTTADVKLRHTIELSAGQQTLEFKAKSGGYTIKSIEVAPIKAEKIASDKTETSIPAVNYYDVQSTAAILKNNVEYTVAGTTLDYQIQTDKAGVYRLNLNYAVKDAAGVTIQAERIMENGTVALGSMDLPATGDWSIFQNAAGMDVKLPAGTYTLRLAIAGDGANLNAVKLKLTEEKAVEEIPLESLSFEKNASSVKEGTVLDLTVQAAPANASNKKVTWSTDNDKVAAVDNNTGKVTAKAAGTAVIRATSVENPDIFAEYTLTVTPAPVTVVKVTEVSLNSKTMSLNVNGSGKLTATVKPDNASNKAVNWTTSNSKVAAVSGGTVKGLSAGTAVITATAADGSGKSASCTVTVTATAVKKSITLNKKSATVNKGKTLTLKATVSPAKDKVTWSSSNTKVAKVDQKGKVTGVKKGTATITAKTASGVKATCKITVKEIKSTKVKLNKTKLTLNKGKSYTLKATMTPKNSTDTLKWTTSNKKVVSVDKNGKIKGLKKGTATITVRTSSGKKATCKVTVKEIKSQKVKLNKTKLTLNKGKSYTLKATMTPKNSTDTLKWTTSNKKVVSVDKNGKIKGLKKGTATITVRTSSGKKATCKVTVKEIKSQKVKLNKTKVTLEKGKTYTLKATITPKNSTDTLKWSTSNAKVVSVDKKGKIKGLKKGTATITVKTSSGKKATCKVTVK